MVKFFKQNKILIGGALLAYLLFKPKAVKASSAITLQDYYVDTSGNYIVMVSGTSYAQGDSVGVKVKDPESEKFNDVVIRSSKNKKIYHVVGNNIADKIFLK